MNVVVRKNILDWTESGNIDLSALSVGLPENISAFLSKYANNMAKVWDSKKPLASTKTISEVSCKRAKPFKQKGTGRARQGHGASPLQVGGGIAHGPKAVRSFFSINKKETKKAKQVGLYLKLQSSSLFVFDDFNIDSISTKAIFSSLLKFSKEKMERSMVFITDLPKDSNFVKSTRNIKNANISTSDTLTNHVLHKSSAVFITKSCLEKMLNVLSK